jgi:pimeloyl-ACP methyl ester carboxylesterase
MIDAQAAIQFLASRTDVDQKHVGIIGHGQGAILASNLAAGLPQQISFLVLLSGTAVNGAKVLLAQMARAEIAAGVPEEKIDADQQIGAVLYRMAAAGRSESEMRQVLESAPEEYAPFLDFWRSQIPRLQSPWLRSFLIHDPSAALAQVKCPVLALFGQKDMTIDPEQNANAMKHAFSKAHNRGAKVKILPDLNYLFQKANTGMPGEYAAIRETMDPSVLEQIQSWIAMQVQ